MSTVHGVYGTLMPIRIGIRVPLDRALSTGRTLWGEGTVELSDEDVAALSPGAKAILCDRGSYIGPKPAAAETHDGRVVVDGEERPLVCAELERLAALHVKRCAARELLERRAVALYGDDVGGGNALEFLLDSVADELGTAVTAALPEARVGHNGGPASQWPLVLATLAETRAKPSDKVLRLHKTVCSLALEPPKGAAFLHEVSDLVAWTVLAPERFVVCEKSTAVRPKDVHPMKATGVRARLELLAGGGEPLRTLVCSHESIVCESHCKAR